MIEAVEELKVEGTKPVSLWNDGNLCFVNAPLQLIQPVFRNTISFRDEKCSNLISKFLQDVYSPKRMIIRKRLLDDFPEFKKLEALKKREPGDTNNFLRMFLDECCSKSPQLRHLLGLVFQRNADCSRCNTKLCNTCEMGALECYTCRKTFATGPKYSLSTSEVQNPKARVNFNIASALLMLLCCPACDDDLYFESEAEDEDESEARVTLPEFITVRTDDQKYYVLEDRLDLGGIIYQPVGFVFANEVHIVAVTKREEVWWECNDHRISKIKSISSWKSHKCYPNLRAALFHTSDTGARSINASQIRSSVLTYEKAHPYPNLLSRTNQEEKRNQEQEIQKEQEIHKEMDQNKPRDEARMHRIVVLVAIFGVLLGCLFLWSMLIVSIIVFLFS